MKYHRDHPASLGADEECLLEAYQQARFRIVVPGSVARGAGIECSDALSAERFFLMDIALSQCAQNGGPLYATRTVPLDGYSMTTGAGLPITDKEMGRKVLRTVKESFKVWPEDPHQLALAVFRTCLAGRAAEHVTYVGAGERADIEEPDDDFAAQPQPQVSRHVAGRNDPCPCGSGRKYKRCCLPRS
jgi:hypothetical protein